MALSPYALEQMGYELIPEGGIEAHFKSLNVYAIRGIVSDDTSPLSPKTLYRVTNDFSFSIGDSVNEIYQILIGDDLVENEESWRKETKSAPPYLITLSCLEEPIVSKPAGYWKHENGEILTYDCFPDARQPVLDKENKASAFLVLLTANLSSVDFLVTFAHLQREVFALTKDKTILRNFRLEVKADVYVSRKATSDTVANQIERTLKSYTAIQSKVGAFFDRANRENDVLKKFIYYFLVIEIHTHQTFRNLNYSESVATLNNIPARINSSAKEFFIQRHEESRNLMQRFVWCCILKWESVTDADIAQFKSIKEFRDKIYHGEDIAENLLPVAQARQLALKLLRSS